MSNYEYRTSGQTDRGTVKEVNQDAVCVKRATYNGEPCIFAMVADGMGGLYDGEKASRMIRDKMEEWFCKELQALLEQKDPFDEDLINEWQTRIEEVNNKLNEEEKSCGTTLTMIFLYNGVYYAANIGDSRIYMSDGKELYQITEDHSWASIAEKDGLTAKEIEEHPNKNKLTKCIGGRVSDFPDVDYFSDTYKKGMSFLLCSDGLRHTIKVKELEDALNDKKNDTKAIALRLINLAKNRNEQDNITAAIVRVIKGEQTNVPVSITQMLEC